MRRGRGIVPLGFRRHAKGPVPFTNGTVAETTRRQGSFRGTKTVPYEGRVLSPFGRTIPTVGCPDERERAAGRANARPVGRQESGPTLHVVGMEGWGRKKYGRGSFPSCFWSGSAHVPLGRRDLFPTRHGVWLGIPARHRRSPSFSGSRNSQRGMLRETSFHSFHRFYFSSRRRKRRTIEESSSIRSFRRPT